jgi:hypothetical protein
MRKLGMLVLVASLSVLASACGGTSDPSPAGSCTISPTVQGVTLPMCFDFAAGTNGPAECATVSAPWVTTSCSTTNRLGTCTNLTGRPGITETFYSPTWTVTAAQLVCAQQPTPGTWTLTSG